MRRSVPARIFPPRAFSLTSCRTADPLHSLNFSPMRTRRDVAAVGLRQCGPWLRALSFVFVLVTVSASAREELQLPPSVARAMKDAGVSADHVSILVRDASTNETVVELNADKPRSPASTIKALTTFVALDSLGPSYTWKTRVYRTGKLTNGVLN